MKKITAKFLLRVKLIEHELAKKFSSLSPMVKSRVAPSVQFVSTVLVMVEEYAVKNAGKDVPSDDDTVLKHDEATLNLCVSAGQMVEKLARLAGGRDPGVGVEIAVKIKKLLTEFRRFIRSQISNEIPF